MKLDEYVSKMDSELEALRADVKKAGRPQLSPLDLSYESLDRAEDFYLLVLDKRVSANKATADRLARYAGATLIENAGGAWAKGPDDSDPFCVTKMKGAPKAQFLPYSRVGELENKMYSGHLRDHAERFDLPLQEKRMKALASDLAGTIKQLRADAKALTGSDPGALDGDVASLDRIEPACAAVNADKATREQRRRIREGATIYLGHVMQQALGREEWTVEDDPRDSALGTWKIYGSGVARFLELVSPQRKGVLREKIQGLIESRGKKKKK